ncbi:MAG: hypothetical protein R3D25_03225 [Geminicoccaceae bacterium]
MTLLAACIVCIVFLLACIALRLVPVASAIVATSGKALATMRDPTLDDDAKEQAARSAAIGLFGGFLSIVWRTAAAVAASLAVLYGGDWLGIFNVDAVMAMLASWEFIIATTVVITILWIAFSRWRSHTSASAPGRR